MADNVHVHESPSSGGGFGLVALIIAVVVLLVVVWFVFAGGGATRDTGTTIQVPEQIDVNVTTPGGDQQ
jgi:uncharacterized membrane protein